MPRLFPDSLGAYALYSPKVSAFAMFWRMLSQQSWKTAFSSGVSGSSRIRSIPSFPRRQGTPAKTFLSPYSPSSGALAGMMVFSSFSTTFAMRAAVAAIPCSVQCFTSQTAHASSKIALLIAFWL